jgi:hypothetical protein
MGNFCSCTDTSTDTRRLDEVQNETLPPPMYCLSSDDQLSTYYTYRQRTKSMYSSDELNYLRQYDKSAKEAAQRAQIMDGNIY